MFFMLLVFVIIVLVFKLDRSKCVLVIFYDFYVLVLKKGCVNEKDEMCVLCIMVVIGMVVIGLGIFFE